MKEVLVQNSTASGSRDARPSARPERWRGGATAFLVGSATTFGLWALTELASGQWGWPFFSMVLVYVLAATIVQPAWTPPRTSEPTEVLRAFVLNRASIRTDEPFQGALDKLMDMAEGALDG